MISKRFFQGLLPGIFWIVLVFPADAAVFFQCPTLSNPSDPASIVYNGSFADGNGDGMIRADDGEIANPVSPTQVCAHLAAGDGFVSMADKGLDGTGDGHLQYSFGFSNVTGMPDGEVMNAGMLAAQFSAPTLTFKEGDDVYLTLSNVGMVVRPDLFDPHSVHWHGFPNAAAIFDGEPMSTISINMGASLTYYYKVVEPGTFMYHCHVEATEHMQMGMLGNLYVTPAQDGNSIGGFTTFAYNDGDGSTGYDVAYPIQIAGFDSNFHDLHLAVQPLPFAEMYDNYPMLNGRGYPDTVNPAVLSTTNPNGESFPSQPVNTIITANTGERILLRLSNLSTESFFTLTVQGIPMQVVGEGSRLRRHYYTTNTVTLGGGQAMDVILDTTGVPAGTYFLYTTNHDRLANNTEDYGGAMTEIVISGAL